METARGCSISTVELLVAGEWRTTQNTKPVRNPFNGDLLAEVSQAGEAEAENACRAAAEAFPETRDLPSWRRSEILERISVALSAATEDIARTIALEAGKPIRDARLEVGRAVSTFHVASEEAKRIGGEVLPLDWSPGSDRRSALVRRVPVGPVLGITPFNFPLNLVAHKVAPAIACGAPIIIKPAPATPLTALRLGRLVTEAGYPAGGISVIPCSNEITRRMLVDERLRKMSFTGGADVGWELKALAGRKHVTLELGGNAAVIIHSDADTETAVAKIAKGAFGYSGQSCISVQRVFAHASVFRVILDRLVELAQSAHCGDPLDEGTDVGPMIHESAAIRARTDLDEAVKAGGQLLTGGVRTGSMLTPAVLTGVPAASRLHREEAFAPVVVVERYENFDEAIGRVNDSRYGLQAGLFTNQWSLIAEAAAAIEVGALLINEVPTWRADHMPYGGVKDSGFGREGVASAIEAMTEPRLLILNF